MTLRIENRLPTVSEFQLLRGEANWGVPDQETTKKVLKNTFSGVVAIKDDAVVGMARTVGDGCLILYVQDVIIASSYRASGIGRTLLTSLLDDAYKSCLPSCTIGLFAATNQSGFYRKLGFSERSNPFYGPGMHAKLSDLAKANSEA